MSSPDVLGVRYLFDPDSSGRESQKCEILSDLQTHAVNNLLHIIKTQARKEAASIAFHEKSFIPGTDGKSLTLDYTTRLPLLKRIDEERTRVIGLIACQGKYYYALVRAGNKLYLSESLQIRNLVQRALLAPGGYNFETTLQSQGLREITGEYCEILERQLEGPTIGMILGKKFLNDNKSLICRVLAEYTFRISRNNLSSWLRLQRQFFPIGFHFTRLCAALIGSAAMYSTQQNRLPGAEDRLGQVLLYAKKVLDREDLEHIGDTDLVARFLVEWSKLDQIQDESHREREVLLADLRERKSVDWPELWLVVDLIAMSYGLENGSEV